jgi:hypothetical protein
MEEITMAHPASNRVAKPTLSDREHLVPGLVLAFEAQFTGASWPQRYHLLEEIFDYLEANSRDPQSVPTTFSQIVEQLVSRTGGARISCHKQAHIYTASASARHRRLADHWFSRERHDQSH